MPEQVRLEAALQLSYVNFQFEVQIVQAGQTKPTYGFPKGLMLSEAVLQASVPLWNNVQSYVDHAIGQHSLRDLCGVISNPEWDDTAKAVKAVFTPFGPAAEVARTVANDVIDHPELIDQVGFSADFYFETDKGEVRQIVQANSADLVIHPAAGGKWLRALNSLHEETIAMTEPVTPTIPVTPPAATPPAAISEAERNLQHLQAGAQAVVQS